MFVTTFASSSAGPSWVLLRFNSLWKAYSCLRKPSLGLIKYLYFLTCCIASTRDMPSSCIRYAITIVALLETPAKQCTSTHPPYSKAILRNLIHDWKCAFRFALGLSNIVTTLYWKLLGNFGGIPDATVRICVMPCFLRSNLLYAADISPSQRLSKILFIALILKVFVVIS